MTAINVGDIVRTRCMNSGFKDHHVTQVIFHSEMLILDGMDGRYASSISISRLEFRDGVWYEKEDD